MTCLDSDQLFQNYLVNIIIKKLSVYSLDNRVKIIFKKIYYKFQTLKFSLKFPEKHSDLFFSMLSFIKIIKIIFSKSCGSECEFCNATEYYNVTKQLDHIM